MHRLLARQVRKYLDLGDEPSAPLRELLDAVSRAYEQADSDRSMLERALELSSEDLFDANRNLRQSVSLLEATLDATGDGILVVDHLGRVTAHNKRFADLFTLPDGHLENADASELLDKFVELLAQPGDVVDAMWDVMSHPNESLTETVAFKDGRHFELHTQPQKIGDRTVGRVWSFHDITELKRAEATIRHTAYHDDLTGLPNRALFQDRFDVALAQAKRQQSAVGIFFIDLDGFKRVNDSLGHTAGDELLKVVASRLDHHVRDGDTLARFGGDEFVLVVSNLRSAGAARILAARLLDAVRPPVVIDGHSLRVTASIGVAMYPNDSIEAEALIRHADTALYLAKDLGRNTFQLFRPDIGERNTARIRLESELRLALDRRELSVVYQPQVSAVTGETLCLEALSRWPRDGGAVSPGVFVPIAEEAGIVEELGLRVLEDCLENYPTWHETAGRSLRLSVNVSPLQIQRPGFSHNVIRLLNATGLPPDCFELELTESALMQSREAGIRALNELALLGFRIALDDFGTGFSSLSQLRELPLTTLKIDRVFVKRCHVSPQDRELISTMVRMARSLELTIVAEGAELPEQVEFLREAGCDLIQGYATGRPMEAGAITERLAEERASAGRDAAAPVGDEANPLNHKPASVV